MGSLLIIGAHVTQNANDQQEMAPALAELAQRPEALGAVSAWRPITAIAARITWKSW